QQRDVRGASRTGSLADGSLIDFDDPLQGLPTGDLFVRTGPAGELTQFHLETFVEDFFNQSALARSGDSSDANPHAEGQTDVDVLQVVGFRAADYEPVGLFEFPLRPNTFTTGAEKSAGQRIWIVPNLLRRAYSHHAPAANASTRSEIDDQVGGF